MQSLFISSLILVKRTVQRHGEYFPATLEIVMLCGKFGNYFGSILSYYFEVSILDISDFAL